MNSNNKSDPDTDARTPLVVPRSEHPISRTQISPNALKVLYRLKDAGYQGFLVGGAVRDLLTGRQPKDFDIATDAHPEQVRELFRNCRLIGRRFHLAHVRFGMEIVEVATFRAAHTLIDEDNSVDEDSRRVLDARGRILRDNLYGTIDEDVWRRDFTANALYYNIADFSVWDYVGGVADARDRVMRLIGDPETRYREDPVRMLRAIRFAAKLDFKIHADTAAPIARLAVILDGVPAARLFDEVNKLFLAGYAAPTFDLLRKHSLLEHLFPELAEVLAGPEGEAALKLVRLGLEGTDQRVHADKSVTPSFLFAVLLWPVVRQQAMRHAREEGITSPQLQDAWDTVLSRQLRRISVPRRFSMVSREVVALQPRFEFRSSPRSLRLLDHPRFRAAYDFLLLRAAAGEVDPELGQWWTDVQDLPAEQRATRLEAPPPGTATAPRKRRRRRRRGPSA